ncbi:hypothetical protein LCGC14_0164450 [marine sediment metagenome]|uniref:Uncharacterized protein n=1 Tax=marine sediment metagenome TaxID=412755 RepID=A0A0F9XCV4_9ZZZZ
MDVDEQFDKIIQDAITEASGIDCSIKVQS